jgi:hypothetical protein
MVTKEQAMTCIWFREIKEVMIDPPLNTLTKKVKWRANGECKTWKSRPNEFRLPVRRGLNNFSYIDHTNCHLMEVDE